ncbi:NAD(P)H-binding protein [Streptomyces netropsis]|uniref:NAD(P)H-binding protein n=1 Tax=Streptomyces netropsis TaxID=55404 RepID=UPI0030CA7585
MIVVTGATGNIGRELVERLLAAGVGVRAVSRDPERAGLPAGVEVVRADLTDGADLGALLAGARALFLNIAATGLEAGALIEAATKAGVRRIVFNSSMSVTDTPADEEGFIARAHAAAERAIRDSGLEWTLVRGGMYATNALQWAEQIRSEGVVRGAYAEAVGAPVHEADLADLAAAALLDTTGTHLGQAYVATGPAGVTMAEQVAAIGRALGRPDVRFQEISFEEAVAAMERAGAPRVAAEDIIRYFGASVGQEALVTDAVQRVTGHPARSFEQWARDHVADFR